MQFTAVKLLSAFAVLIVVNMFILRSAHSFTQPSRLLSKRVSRGDFRWMATAYEPLKNSDGPSKNDDNGNKLRSLLSEIKDIVTTPGLASVGVARSLQMAKGLAIVGQEYMRNKNAFLDKNGAISVPKTMRRIFEELGATYIKLGQFIASSPTLFPADFVEEFQACLDRTPTVPYHVIRRIIQEDLNRPIVTMFASIDPTPLASASIAQVHRATLQDGRQVVIKVRKPGVDATLQADLAFLLVATKLIEFINPALSSFSLANIVTDIRESMLDELDFRKEAQNLLNFRAFLVQNNILDATAPEPFLEFSNQRVLTMEFLQGVPLVDLEGIKRYVDEPELTLISALRTWATTVALNDKFHADVHAGNLLVLEDGRVGFIDFGIGEFPNDFVCCEHVTYQARFPFIMFV